MNIHNRVPLLGKHRPAKHDAFAHVDTVHYNPARWQGPRRWTPKAVSLARAKARIAAAPTVNDVVDVDGMLDRFDYEAAEAKVDRLRAKMGGWSGPRIEKASPVPEPSVLIRELRPELLNTSRVQDEIRALALPKIAQGIRKGQVYRPETLRQIPLSPFAVSRLNASRTRLEARHLIRVARLDPTRLLAPPNACRASEAYAATDAC